MYNILPKEKTVLSTVASLNAYILALSGRFPFFRTVHFLSSSISVVLDWIPPVTSNIYREKLTFHLNLKIIFIPFSCQQYSLCIHGKVLDYLDYQDILQTHPYYTTK